MRDSSRSARRGSVAHADGPQRVDRDDMLDRSMVLFWSQGYEATSLTDLIRHLRLNGTSIYRIFGSKHDLYVESLSRYHRKRYEGVCRSLRAIPPLDAIRKLLHEWADLSAGSERRGCFIVSAAVERVPQDSRSEDVVRRFLKGLEGKLIATLEHARRDGQLRPEVDVSSLAGMLLTVMQGMMLVGKVNADPDYLHGIAETALSALE